MEYVVAPRPVLLHLTDLHFGAPEGRGHYWNSEATELSLTPQSRRGLLGGLLRDLRRLELRPDLVIVTGDLLDRGSEAGVASALEFLSALSDKLGLHRGRVVIVPGNHDVLRSSDPAERYTRFDALRSAFYGSIRQPFDAKTPPHLRVERFDYAEALGVEVVGFNSCEVLDPLTKHEHGSVGMAQRDRAEELLEASRGKDLFRIAAMHHHLESPVGIVRDDYSVMEDAGATRLWLAKQRFHLTLHGHQHVDWQEVREIEGWFLSIVAGASAGVARYGREEWLLQLGYQVIVLDEPTRGRRIRREYNPQTMEWLEAGRGEEIQRLRFGVDADDKESQPSCVHVVQGPKSSDRGMAVMSQRTVEGVPSQRPVKSSPGRFAAHREHLEREIVRHRAERRIWVISSVVAMAAAGLVATYFGMNPVYEQLPWWVPPSAGLAVLLAGILGLPIYFFSNQDTVDTLLFLKQGYERCEVEPDPELLRLLNQKFEKLI